MAQSSLCIPNGAARLISSLHRWDPSPGSWALRTDTRGVSGRAGPIPGLSPVISAARLRNPHSGPLGRGEPEGHQGGYPGSHRHLQKAGSVASLGMRPGGALPRCPGALVTRGPPTGKLQASPRRSLERGSELSRCTCPGPLHAACLFHRKTGWQWLQVLACRWLPRRRLRSHRLPLLWGSSVMLATLHGQTQERTPECQRGRGLGSHGSQESWGPSTRSCPLCGQTCMGCQEGYSTLKGHVTHTLHTGPSLPKALCLKEGQVMPGSVREGPAGCTVHENAGHG